MARRGAGLNTMTIEEGKTAHKGGDIDVRWGETLRGFVRRVGALPPSEAYELHPIYDDLLDLLVQRRASWEGAYEGEARTICRSFIMTEYGLACLGGSRRDLLKDREDGIAFARNNPQHRPSKWREVARLRALVAELLSPNVPDDELTWTCWHGLRGANYVPHVADLTREVEWPE